MLKQKTQFVFKEVSSEILELSKQFELRIDRPFSLIQKACFWLLKSLKLL